MTSQHIEHQIICCPSPCFFHHYPICLHDLRW